MKLVDFPGTTCVIAKDQPQYDPMPAYRDSTDPEGHTICCWHLSWRERFTVLVTGRLWHHMLTFRQSVQPQLLTTEKPQFNT